VEDVTFDMRWRLECNAQTSDRSDQVAAHNNVLSHDPASHLRLVAEQKRAAMNVALNLAVDLDLAFRGDVAAAVRNSYATLSHYQGLSRSFPRAPALTAN